MKALIHYIDLLIVSSCLACSPLPGYAQATHAPTPHNVSAAQETVTPDPYLDQVIATVETRKITRRDVARLYLDFNPTALATDTTSAGIQTTKPTGADITDLAPQIFDKKGKKAPARKILWDVLASTTELHRLAERIFSTHPVGLDDCISILMQTDALRTAAERRHVPARRADIEAEVHVVLDRIRASRGLPKEAGMSDRVLAQNLVTSYKLHYQTVEIRMLKRNLILSDLNDRLGHPPQADDFYSAHVILLPVEIKNPASPAADWEQGRQQAETLRTDIIAKRKTFEEAAKQLSDDPSARFGGDAGALVRTLLPTDLEQAVLRLQPGEITPPIRVDAIKAGYVLLRFDKLGRDLTDAERQRALALCCSSRTREQNVLARVLKDIDWSTTVGKPPEWFRKPATN